MAYDDDVLALGPVAFWLMDDGTGSSAADVSGNGYTLTEAGASPAFRGWVADPVWGTCADGGEDNMHVWWEATTSSIDGDSPWSVSFWLRQQPGNYPIGGQPDGYFHGTAVWAGISGISVGIDRPTWNPPSNYLGTAENWNGTASGNLYPADDDDVAWHHYVGTFDGTTLRVYEDGGLVTSGSGSGSGSPAGGGFRITWSGCLARLAVFDYGLSAPQVAALAVAPVPYGPPDTGLWDDFDRADGALGTASCGWGWSS